MYSHSRLNSFEQCPQKYSFRYIQGIKVDTEGVEAFMGKRVHETLEKLYKDLKFTKKMSLDETLAWYEREWEKTWHAHVQIVRTEFNPGHYFELGKRCIRDYYKRYDPFDQGRTLGLEERVEVQLSEGDKTYSLQGYIDRITWDPIAETYEIHDYKTGSALPTQDQADADRQLALYEIGIRQRWPDAKKVKLVWHYLATDKELTSTRTPAALKALEKSVIELIQEVQAESARGLWPPLPSALCGWCEYKPICPAFKHELLVKAMPVNEYLADAGVDLVRKFAALDAQKADQMTSIRAIELEQEKIKVGALAYAKHEGLTAIQGPEHRLIIRTEEEFKAPRKTEDPLAWELLRTTLKNAGKLEDVSTVNGNMLKFGMKKGKWPASVVKTVEGICLNDVVTTVALVKNNKP